MTRTVATQSAPGRKLAMRLVPSAMAANITARWLMDLSPGTRHCPARGDPLWTVRIEAIGRRLGKRVNGWAIGNQATR